MWRIRRSCGANHDSHYEVVKPAVRRASGNGIVQVIGIGGAMAASSVLGLVFLGMASRWMSPAQYAAFMSSWGLVFGLAAAMLVTEQEVARRATIARINGVPTPASTVRVAAVSSGFALMALAVVLLTPAGRQAVGNSVTVAAIGVLSVLGFASQYLVRAISLGRRHTTNYMIVIIGDGAIRVAALGVMLLAGSAPSINLALFAVALGCFSWLLVLHRERNDGPPSADGTTWRSDATTMAPLMAGNVLQAILLTAYPTLATAFLGVTDDLATFFGVVTLSRIPLIAISPIQTLAVPVTTDLVHSGRTGVLTTRLTQFALATAAVAGIGWVVAYFAGPWLVHLFLGDQYSAASGTLVGSMIVGGCVMAAAMLQAAVLVALQRPPLVITTWASGVALATALLVWWPGSIVDRAAAGFLGGSLAAFAVSAILVALAARKEHARQLADRPAPDARQP